MCVQEGVLECVCAVCGGTVHKALHKQINKQNINFCTRHCTSRRQFLSLFFSSCCLACTLLMPGTFLCFGGFSGAPRALCQVLTLALITIIIISSYNNNHFVPINAAAPPSSCHTSRPWKVTRFLLTDGKLVYLWHIYKHIYFFIFIVAAHRKFSKKKRRNKNYELLALKDFHPLGKSREKAPVNERNKIQIYC